MQALYDELLKFSSQEDVELLRKTLGQEIKDSQDRTEEWGNYVEDKFKDYLSIHDFEDLFTSTTEGLKEQDTQLREKTLELEETVQNMRAALAIVHEHVPWPSNDGTTNSQTDNDTKLVQADIKRFQQKM